MGQKISLFLSPHYDSFNYFYLSHVERTSNPLRLHERTSKLMCPLFYIFIPFLYKTT